MVMRISHTVLVGLATVGACVFVRRLLPAHFFVFTDTGVKYIKADIQDFVYQLYFNIVFAVCVPAPLRIDYRDWDYSLPLNIFTISLYLATERGISRQLPFTTSDF